MLATLAQSNILQYFFSWTAQLKCIKHKIHCSNLADFKYTSRIPKVQLQGFLIKHINT